MFPKGYIHSITLSHVFIRAGDQVVSTIYRDQIYTTTKTAWVVWWFGVKKKSGRSHFHTWGMGWYWPDKLGKRQCSKTAVRLAGSRQST